MARHSREDNERDRDRWPDLEYGNNETDATYIHQDNVDLVLDLVKAALNSQHEGVKQIYTKLITILTQSSALVSLSLTAEYWLYTKQQQVWPCVSAGILVLGWSAAAFFAAVGIRSRQISSLGIDPRDGLNQDLLERDPRQVKVWAIETVGNTYLHGKRGAAKIGVELDRAINCIIAAPLVSLMISLVWIALSRLSCHP